MAVFITDHKGRSLLPQNGEASVNRSSHAVTDPETGKIRTLTPVEAERINGFPENWTNLPGVTNRFRFFAMGNALVVPVITLLGEAILRFDKSKS